MRQVKMIEKKPLLAAFDHWLTGILFAVLLASAMAFMVHAPFFGWVLRMVEAQGIDTSMVLGSPSFTEAVGDEKVMGRNNFVFVDIDAEACHAVAPNDPLCFSRSPAVAEAASRVVRAVLTAKPKLVIIDTPLSESSSPAGADEDLEAMHDAVKSSAIPVLAVLPAEKIDAQQLMASPQLIPVPLRDNVIKFAPAFLKRGRDGSEVARVYPKAFPVITNGHCQLQATLPFQAAQILRNAPFAQDAACPSLLKESSHPLGEHEEEDRFLFTLPSVPARGGLANVDRRDRAHLERRIRTYSGLYDHFLATELMDVGAPTPALKRLANRIEGRTVIISSSTSLANDLHQTPFGPMSGAEVILNATRSFAADLDLKEPSLFEKIGKEAIIAFLISPAFFLFWWLENLTEARIRSVPTGKEVRGLKLQLHVMCLRSLIVVMFAGTIALAVAILMFINAVFVHQGVTLHKSIDVLTPLLSLSLEGFAEGSLFIISALHGGVERVRAGLTQLVFRSGKT